MAFLKGTQINPNTFATAAELAKELFLPQLPALVFAKRKGSAIIDDPAIQSDFSDQISSS